MITTFIDGITYYFTQFLEFANYLAYQLSYQLSSPTDSLLWIIFVFIFYMFFCLVAFYICRFFFNLIWRIIGI